MIQMPSIPQYILESSICLMIFYALYYLFLRKDTFHHFNKYYILTTALVAVLLPFIDFDTIDSTQKATATIEPLIQYRADLKQYESGISNNMFYSITVGDILKGIFYVGVFLTSLKFMYVLFQLLDRLKKVRNRDTKDSSHVSFYGYTLFSFLFWNDDLQDKKGNEIVKENTTKLRPWHSMDVIIIELLAVINWLNPLIYLFRNRFYKINEYIVDEKISTAYPERKEYIEELMRINIKSDKGMKESSNASFLDRIMMLTRKRTSSIGKLKPLMIIPMTFVMLTLYSFDYAEKIPEELKSTLEKVELNIENATDHVVLNLTHSERNYEWEFRWGQHLYGLTSKDDNGNMIYDLSKEVSLYDLYESIGSTPSYKTKGVYESMGFDIKITSNSDTVSNISVPIGEYESLESKMKNEIIKHKTPFSIYFSKIGSTNDERNGGFMIKVFQYINSDKEEGQDEVNEVKAKWGDLNLNGVDFGWIMNDKKGFKAYGKFTGFGVSQDPFIITKDEFLNKVNSNFSLMVNDKKMELDEDVMLVMKIRRAEMVQSQNDWNPDPENIKTSKGSRSVQSVTTVYHGRTMARVEDDYDFKEILNGGDEYVYSVLESVTDEDVVTIAAIDTLNATEQGDHYFFSMTIKEKDAAYKSPYAVELPPTSSTFNNFQIYYNVEDDQTYVKVDTTAKGNENIVKAYRHSESYQLTHVPDFKTKKRVNDKRALPGGKLNIDPKMNLTVSVLRMERLNEHYTLSDRMIRLDWGKMISLPGIGNFSNKEFRRSSLSNILLSAGDNFLDVKRFDLVIIAEGSDPVRIRTDNIKSLLCRKALREIESSASIYFDNIIVNDEDEFKYYPYQFVFNVE